MQTWRCHFLRDFLFLPDWKQIGRWKLAHHVCADVFLFSSSLVDAVCMSLSAQSPPCQAPSARSMLSSPSLPIASPETSHSRVPRPHAGLLIMQHALHPAQQSAHGQPSPYMQCMLPAARQPASGLLILTTTRPADSLDARHAGAKGDRVCGPG